MEKFSPLHNVQYDKEHSNSWFINTDILKSSFENRYASLDAPEYLSEVRSRKMHFSFQDCSPFFQVSQYQKKQQYTAKFVS